jgi:2-iminobutanoate/2-iminopropanoate deaminase
MTANRNVIHLEGTDFQKSRAFSPAVVTEGGKIVWLAGQTALYDLDGKSIAHDFEAQVRTCFALIDRTLNRVGGKLADLVTMTVSINDPRNGDRFIKIRHEMFPDGKFPCSALITVSNFCSLWNSDRNSGRRGGVTGPAVRRELSNVRFTPESGHD